MELVKDKLAIKTVEKFGKYLELALDKHQDKDKENEDAESNDENHFHGIFSTQFLFLFLQFFDFTNFYFFR